MRYYNMIQIKLIFSGWKEVSREQAIKFVNNNLKDSPALSKDEKTPYINARLKSIIKAESMFGLTPHAAFCRKEQVLK